MNEFPRLRALFTAILMLFIILDSQGLSADARVTGNFVTDTWNQDSPGSARRTVVRDAHGNLYVALVVSLNKNNVSPYSVKLFASKDRGITWVSVPDPQAFGVGSGKGFALAIDSKNHLHLVYHEEYLSEQLFHQEFNGVSWFPREQFSTDPASGGRAPMIAIDSRDNLHVVWESTHGGAELYRRRIAAMEQWDSIVNLGPPAYQSTIGVDYNDNLHILSGYGEGLFYRKAENGIFGKIEAVSNVPDPEARHATLAFDSGSKPHVVWVGDGYGAGWRIYYSRRDSNGWTVRELVSSTNGNDSGSDHFHDPMVAIDQQDNVHVIYDDRSSDPNVLTSLFYKQRKIYGGWSDEVVLTDPQRMASYPSIRYSVFPEFNRVVDQSDLDFVWVERSLDSMPLQYGFGVGLADTDSPALIQSRWPGKAIGSFEVVVREGSQLCHYYRSNVNPGYPWSKTACFGEGITTAPALIQSTFGNPGNFEVVAGEGDRLCHYFRNNSAPGHPWSKTQCFGDNIASNPALIQSRWPGKAIGSFEVMVREGEQLCHYYRSNITAGYPWAKTACFGEGVDSAPALIQSTFGYPGNFEVVVKEGDQLCHYYRNNSARGYPWSKTHCFSSPVDSAPALLQSRWPGKPIGSFELVVREQDQLCHYYRSNVAPRYPWVKTACFGEGVTTAPALIQSTFGNPGNFDVVVGRTTDDGTQGLQHYYRANGKPGYPWYDTSLFGVADN